ncbi:MAG: hypothetical protein WCF84_02805 [Anaerolineae bacterium]
MEEPNQAALPEGNQPAPPAPPLITQEYRGNQYDLYSLLAGTLGGATLLMCFSGGIAYYCLPIVPLVLGIIALRRANTAADPRRTRNLAWIGIAGGGIGTLLLLVMIAFFVLYLGIIFAVIGSGIQSLPRSR